MRASVRFFFFFFVFAAAAVAAAAAALCCDNRPTQIFKYSHHTRLSIDVICGANRSHCNQTCVHIAHLTIPCRMTSPHAMNNNSHADIFPPYFEYPTCNMYVVRSCRLWARTPLTNGWRATCVCENARPHIEQMAEAATRLTFWIVFIKLCDFKCDNCRMHAECACMQRCRRRRIFFPSQFDIYRNTLFFFSLTKTIFVEVKLHDELESSMAGAHYSFLGQFIEIIYFVSARD